MGRFEIPLLVPEEFNDNAARILRAAEEIIFEECCSNSCVHVPNGGYADAKVNQPSGCRFLKVGAGAPLECEAFEMAVEPCR